MKTQIFIIFILFIVLHKIAYVLAKFLLMSKQTHVKITTYTIMNYTTKSFLIVISAVYAVAILKLKDVVIMFLIMYMWYLYSIEAKKLATLKRGYEIIEKN